MLATISLAGTSLCLPSPISGALAQVAGPDPAEGGCPAGETLLDLKELDAARQTFVAVLRKDPASACARAGLVEVGMATKTAPLDACAIAAALHTAGADTDARDVLKAEVKKGTAGCAAEYLKKLNQKSTPERVADWSAAAGKLIPAILTGLLLLVLLLANVRPSRKVLLRIVQPELAFGAFGDPSTDPKAAATIAALAMAAHRELHKNSLADVGPTLRQVDNYSELASAADDLGKISPQLAPVAAFLKILQIIIRRPRLKVSGQLHAAGKRGPGLTLRLANGNRIVEGATLWAGPGSGSSTVTEDDYV